MTARPPADGSSMSFNTFTMSALIQQTVSRLSHPFTQQCNNWKSRGICGWKAGAYVRAAGA